jgi:hypothetical protein
MSCATCRTTLKRRYVSRRSANRDGFAATKLDLQAAFKHRYTSGNQLSDRLDI